MMLSFAYFIATGFGSGRLPKAPGTWGSIVGLGLCFAVYSLSGLCGLLVLTILTTLSGWWASHFILTRHFADPDPCYIVMDEIAGIALTLLLSVYTLNGASFDMFIIGFFMFRLFDIWKPWPISWIDHALTKTPKQAAVGIMIDDLLAAIPATLITIYVHNLGLR